MITRRIQPIGIGASHWAARKITIAAVIWPVSPSPAAAVSRPMYATSLTPTAPGVIGMKAMIATAAIAASTADGGSIAGVIPTAQSETSRTRNQASFATTAAA